MAKYGQVHPLDFLSELKERILSESLSQLSRGSMFFNQDGVIITDDSQNEWISPKSNPVVVETPYAEHLSWVFFRLKDGLEEVIFHYNKTEFFGILAENAARGVDKGMNAEGIAMTVLSEAAVMTGKMLRQQSQLIKDELLSCAGSLSDLAEKID